MIPNKRFWAWLLPSPFFNKDGHDIDENVSSVRTSNKSEVKSYE